MARITSDSDSRVESQVEAAASRLLKLVDVQGIIAGAKLRRDVPGVVRPIEPPSEVIRAISAEDSLCVSVTFIPCSCKQRWPTMPKLRRDVPGVVRPGRERGGSRQRRREQGTGEEGWQREKGRRAGAGAGGG